MKVEILRLMHSPYVFGCFFPSRNHRPILGLRPFKNQTHLFVYNVRGILLHIAGFDKLDSFGRKVIFYPMAGCLNDEFWGCLF